MQRNKIKFSDRELKFIGESETILLQKSIIEKMVRLFAGFQKTLHTYCEDTRFFHLYPPEPGEVNLTRGNNYKGLPYVVLDYPKLISKEDIFNFRTFFWWGSGISSSLHLEGKSLESFRAELIANAGQLSAVGNFFLTGKDSWVQDLSDSNYIKTDNFNTEELRDLLKNSEFVRLASPFSGKLNEKDFNQFGLENFKFLISLLRT